MVKKLWLNFVKVVQKIKCIFNRKKLMHFDDVEKDSIFSTDNAFNTIRTEDGLFQYLGNYCKLKYL